MPATCLKNLYPSRALLSGLVVTSCCLARGTNDLEAKKRWKKSQSFTSIPHKKVSTPTFSNKVSTSLYFNFNFYSASKHPSSTLLSHRNLPISSSHVKYRNKMRLPNSWTLFQVWCLANTAVHAAPDPKAAPEPKAAPDHKAAPDLNPSLEADPLPVTTLIPRSELEPRFWPLVWEAFQAVGTIGGVLGVFNSLRGYGEEIMDSVHKKDKNKNGNSKEPEKPPAPWVVGIQVGLDGTGLHVCMLQVME